MKSAVMKEVKRRLVLYQIITKGKKKVCNENKCRQTDLLRFFANEKLQFILKCFVLVQKYIQTTFFRKHFVPFKTSKKHA